MNRQTLDPEAASAEPPSPAGSRAAGFLSLFPQTPRIRACKPPLLPVGDRTESFRRLHYPGIGHEAWNDWRWQLKNRISTLSQLASFLRLSGEELASGGDPAGGASALPLAITPYYLSLMDPDNPDDPLRRTMVPTGAERRVNPGEAPDPLSEDGHSPVPGLVHRYPDRVLFLTTDYCAAYCRYCTRSRRVGKRACSTGNRGHWAKALDYIARTPSVRDVLISGGDPLTMSDAALDDLLSRLRAIPHVEIVRIGTKAPMVLPQRITRELTRILKRHHPLFVSVHCTHPAELTPESAEAFKRLADAGIPLGSQTVLLQGVNNDPQTMKQLMHGLLKNRVRPYYLYHCDPVEGIGHFRTAVDAGVEIIRSLRGHTSGYAVPTYVVDAPGGGGKIPLSLESVAGRQGPDLLLRNYEGKIYSTPDHAALPLEGCEA